METLLPARENGGTRVSGSGEQSQPENLYRYTKVENRVLRRVVFGEAIALFWTASGVRPYTRN